MATTKLAPIIKAFDQMGLMYAHRVNGRTIITDGIAMCAGPTTDLPTEAPRLFSGEWREQPDIGKSNAFPPWEKVIPHPREKEKAMLMPETVTIRRGVEKRPRKTDITYFVLKTPDRETYILHRYLSAACRVWGLPTSIHVTDPCHPVILRWRHKRAWLIIMPCKGTPQRKETQP